MLLLLLLLLLSVVQMAPAAPSASESCFGITAKNRCFQEQVSAPFLVAFLTSCAALKNLLHQLQHQGNVVTLLKATLTKIDLEWLFLWLLFLQSRLSLEFEVEWICQTLHIWGVKCQMFWWVIDNRASLKNLNGFHHFFSRLCINVAI